MIKNIAKISNVDQSPHKISNSNNQNIIKIRAKCENMYCPEWEFFAKLVCKKCRRIICYDCTYKNCDKCLVCQFKYPEELHKTCFECCHYVKFAMCWECSNILKYCGGDCEFNGAYVHEQQFYCKYCYYGEL